VTVASKDTLICAFAWSFVKVLIAVREVNPLGAADAQAAQPKIIAENRVDRFMDIGPMDNSIGIPEDTIHR
jgi:hypothetical protein